MAENSNVEAYSRSQVKKGTVISYLALVINILSGLIFTPWLIHQLGDSDYGIYSIGTSIITLLIMDFGVSEAVAKYVAQYRTEGKEDKIDNLISVVTKIYLLLAVVFLVIFVILYFFIGNIYVSLSPKELDKLRIVYVIVAVYNIFAFTFTPLSGIMLAYEHLVSLKLCDIITRLATIAITVIAIEFGMGLFSAVLANALAGIIVIAYKLFIVQRRHHFKLNLKYRNQDLLKKILSFSVWVAILIITQRCIYSITPSILGALSGSSETTLYSISSTLEGYIYSFGSVICTMLLAKITRMISTNDIKGFNELMINTGKIQFILISMILVGFICVGKEFIGIWMGDGYEITYYMTILLLLPNLFIWPFMTVGVGLTVISRVKEQALVNLGTAVINIAMECMLVGRFGAIGAVISIAIANSFKGIALIFVYKKFLTINLKKFGWEIFGRYGGASLVIAGVLIIITSKITLENVWGNFLLKSLITVVLYVMIIMLVITVTDKSFLKKQNEIVGTKR